MICLFDSLLPFKNGDILILMHFLAIDERSKQLQKLKKIANLSILSF
jgi:hypothetical protein